MMFGKRLQTWLPRNVMTSGCDARDGETDLAQFLPAAYALYDR